MNLKGILVSLASVALLTSCNSCSQQQVKIDKTQFYELTKDSASKNGCYNKISINATKSITKSGSTTPEVTKGTVEIEFKEWQRSEESEFCIPSYTLTKKSGDNQIDAFAVNYIQFGAIHTIKYLIDEEAAPLESLGFYKNPLAVTLSDASIEGKVNFDNNYFAADLYMKQITEDDSALEITAKLSSQDFIKPNSQN